MKSTDYSRVNSKKTEKPLIKSKTQSYHKGKFDDFFKTHKEFTFHKRSKSISENYKKNVCQKNEDFFNKIKFKIKSKSKENLFENTIYFENENNISKNFFNLKEKRKASNSIINMPPYTSVRMERIGNFLEYNTVMKSINSVSQKFKDSTAAKKIINLCKNSNPKILARSLEKLSINNTKQKLKDFENTDFNQLNKKILSTYIIRKSNNSRYDSIKLKVNEYFEKQKNKKNVLFFIFYIYNKFKMKKNDIMFEINHENLKKFKKFHSQNLLMIHDMAKQTQKEIFEKNKRNSIFDIKNPFKEIF